MNIWKAIIFLIPCLTLAQVNTENLRADEKKGFSGKLSLGYGMAMGNSEYLSFTPAARIDFNTTWYSSFIAASYNRKQRALKKDRASLLAHKGFAHVRTARIFNSLFSWELFGQWEFNAFISLERRLLGGTGARMNLLHSFPDAPVRLLLGMGGMYEQEVYTTEADKALVRSTNYITFSWNFSRQGSLHTTAYYQVAVTQPGDFRILSDSGLRLKLAAWLVFGTSVGIRYDNDPIAGVAKKYDLEMNNDLTVAF